MVRFPGLFCGLLIGCGLLTVPLASAAQAQIPEKDRYFTGVGNEIAWKRAVPKSVARHMPPKSKELFWGTLQAKRPGVPDTLLGVHCYFRDIFLSPSFARNTYFLDLYRQERGATGFHRVNRITFRCPDIFFPPERVGAKWTWLRPATHQGLALALHLETNGADNDDVFVGLPDKLPAPATPVAVRWGSWMASDICGIHSDFIHGDDGKMEVRVTLSPSGDPPLAIVQRDYQFTLTWNEKRHRFWPTAKARRILQDYEFLRQEILP